MNVLKIKNIQNKKKERKKTYYVVFRYLISINLIFIEIYIMNNFLFLLLVILDQITYQDLIKTSDTSTYSIGISWNVFNILFTYKCRQFWRISWLSIEIISELNTSYKTRQVFLVKQFCIRFICNIKFSRKYSIHKEY